MIRAFPTGKCLPYLNPRRVKNPAARDGMIKARRAIPDGKQSVFRCGLKGFPPVGKLSAELTETEPAGTKRLPPGGEAVSGAD